MRQFQILLILDIFGVGVISLPSFAASFAEQDAWITVLISAAAAFLCVFIITTLGRGFYKDTFYGYAGKILSKPVGTAVCLLFIIKIIFTAAFQLRIFCEIIKITMLSRTPQFITGVLIISVSAYAAAKGIEARARMAELLFLLTLLPMLFVILFASKDVDYSNILPILTAKPQDLLSGGFWNLISFTGIEFCLFAPFYTSKPEKLRKSALTAVLTLGAAMCFITVITVCAFGYEDVTKHMWPVLDMINAISMPGSFIERQDAVIASFWIASIFQSLSACLFFASLLAKDVVKKGRREPYVIICALVVFIISVLPENIAEVYMAQKALFLTLGVFFMLVLPFIMLVAAKIRGLGDNFENR